MPASFTAAVVVAVVVAALSSSSSASASSSASSSSASSSASSAPPPHLLTLQPCQYGDGLQTYSQQGGPLNPVTGLPTTVAYLTLGAGVGGMCVVPVAFSPRAPGRALIAAGDCSLPIATWNVTWDPHTNGMQLSPSVSPFFGLCLSAPEKTGGALGLSACGPGPAINETQLWGFNGNPAFQGLFPFSNMKACATVASS
jgi:hypothetical protein